MSEAVLAPFFWIVLWLDEATATRAFARLVGRDLSGLGLGLCHTFVSPLLDLDQSFIGRAGAFLALVAKTASGRAITESPLIYVHPLS